MENWVGNVSEGNMKLVPYEADQYGNSSYILTIKPQEGEFGVRIVNPNDRDEKVPILYCYGSHNTPKIKSNNTDISELTQTEYEIRLDGINHPVYKNYFDELFIVLPGKKIRQLNDEEQKSLININDNM